MISTVLLGAVWIGFSLCQDHWANKNLVLAMVLGETLMLSILSVSLFSMFITLSWPVVAATQFTAYMALLNMSNALGAWLAGPMRAVFVPESAPVLPGIANIFMAVGLFQVAVVGIFVFIDPGQTRRVLGEGPAETKS